MLNDLSRKKNAKRILRNSFKNELQGNSEIFGWLLVVLVVFVVVVVGVVAVIIVLEVVIGVHKILGV